ncbi:hypothetical protein RM844_32845, partial [Streptomyces sp. DSM 44915]|nr:hypothetical protein [Streptomyces sp. DSM 44915]
MDDVLSVSCPHIGRARVDQGSLSTRNVNGSRLEETMRHAENVTGMSLALSARWVFPVNGPPLARGVVVVDGSQITAVLPAGERAADVDFGNAAILPGLVNAHTHLDLSDAAGKCPPTPDFSQWLRRVVAHRRGQTDV